MPRKENRRQTRYDTSLHPQLVVWGPAGAHTTRKKLRPGTVEKKIPDASSYSGSDVVVRVTLAKAPWETD